MLRYFFLSLALAVIAILAIAGFRGERSEKAPIVIFPDMDDQPKYTAQHGSTFYADGRAARHAVEGTVPQGFTLPDIFSINQGNNARKLDGDAGFTNSLDYAQTGKFGEVWGDGIPMEVNEALLHRGQERFNINCAVCHGPVGLGDGIVGKYGVGGIANLLESRFQTMPDGNIFDTITHGKGNMGAYGPNVTVEDRWAIVAYIRALQKSQNAAITDVPEELRTELEKQ